MCLCASLTETMKTYEQIIICLYMKHFSLWPKYLLLCVDSVSVTRCSSCCVFNVTCTVCGGWSMTYTWTISGVIDSETFIFIFIESLTLVSKVISSVHVLWLHACAFARESKSDMAAELYWMHPDVQGLFPKHLEKYCFWYLVCSWSFLEEFIFQLLALDQTCKSANT